jgi:acetyl-CoA carboxylase biotin carboxyl carrier protein
LELEQIKELIAQLEGSKLKKIVVKKGDFEISLEKEGDLPLSLAHLPPHYQPPRFLPHPEQHASVVEQTPFMVPAAAAPVAVAGQYVTSPMVGTFYALPAPDQPPYVKVGDQINENTVVCVVEAMKVMNEVKAGIAGTVAEVLIDNAEPVEFGTKMFRVV